MQLERDQIVKGAHHGKRDRDGYVCSHGVCETCGEVVFKLWLGNAAGQREATRMIRSAIVEHRCGEVR